MARVFRTDSWMGGAKNDEGLEVFRCPEGVHSQAVPPTACPLRRSAARPATYFNSKTKYDGLLPTEMRLKQLEDENVKLKNLVAVLSLDKEMLQGVIRRKL